MVRLIYHEHMLNPFTPMRMCRINCVVLRAADKKWRFCVLLIIVLYTVVTHTV